MKSEDESQNDQHRGGGHTYKEGGMEKCLLGLCYLFVEGRQKLKLLLYCSSGSVWTLSSNPNCGHLAGPSTTGATEYIACKVPVTGNYLTIQLADKSSFLQIEDIIINTNGGEKVDSSNIDQFE